MRTPVGIRIRRLRMELGISQADLARAVGISSSYLNLIESARRNVGGPLLQKLADRMEVGLDALSGDGEQKTLQLLRDLMGDPALQGLDFGRTDTLDLLGRFPEVAQALIRLHRAGNAALAEVEAFETRFNSDPLLGQMLHEVLNRLTGMRSSAEILEAVEDLGEADRRRFTGTINREARELSAQMRGLVGYFDRASVRRRAISPLRAVEDAFIAANNHFAPLEELAEDLRAGIGAGFDEAGLASRLSREHGVICPRDGDADAAGALYLPASAAPATRIFRICQRIALEAAPGVLAEVCAGLDLDTEEARRHAILALASYVAGAMMMPYGPFRADAEAHRYDIDLLSHRHGASFEQVAHRLTTLRRAGAEGVPFGFLRSDPAGRLTKRFPLPGLSLPGGGHGCLLWPIYQTTAAGGVLRRLVEFPNGARFLMIARSVVKPGAGWRDPPMSWSVMLACDIHQAGRTVYAEGLDLGATGMEVPVGPSCAHCTRSACGYRQEEGPAPIAPVTALPDAAPELRVARGRRAAG